jgi:hypothetical protein
MRLTARVAGSALRVVSRVVVLLVPTLASAQDANYWTVQYGPVAQLLGGQVVGSTRDLSATYYNPGGLALSKDPAFLLSVQAVLVQGVSLDPTTAGALRPTSSWTLGVAPSLIAGMFPKGWFGENTRLAWSYLTRQQSDVTLDSVGVGTLPGSGARYGAESLFTQNMTEGWGGLTLCHRLSDSWGLGITAYGVYRGQQTRREESAQVGGAGAGLAALAIEDFSYYHWRTLAKIGVAWDSGRSLKLGLAVTTPSLGVFGGGEAGFTKSVTGVDGDGNPVNVLDNGLDEGARVQYRSKAAVAGGAAWRLGETSLHFSGEWYAPVSLYPVLTAGGSEGAPSYQLSQELKGVFNLGAGFEHRFSRSTVAYGAVATDYNAAVGTPRLGVAASNWNLLHLTAGTAFDVMGSHLTLGASYAFGSSTRQLGFEGLPPEAPVLGARPNVSVHYNRLTFVLGFVFGG